MGVSGMIHLVDQDHGCKAFNSTGGQKSGWVSMEVYQAPSDSPDTKGVPLCSHRTALSGQVSIHSLQGWCSATVQTASFSYLAYTLAGD